jgi:type IV secretory pathway VirB2 component (pilin)
MMSLRFSKQEIFRSFRFLIGYLTFFPAVACADVAGTLNNFLSYLTGDVGKVVSCLAIVSVGFACFVLGKLPKSYVISVVVGIGLIFGSSALVNTLAT